MVKINDQKLNEIAEMAHEANRFYCKKIGDHTQEIWDDAPSWQKDSARKGVLFVYNNQHAGFEAQHESWLNEKREDGWVYGKKKDEKKKKHPCFVRYEDLPEEQRVKDMIFVSVVNALLFKNFIAK